MTVTERCRDGICLHSNHIWEEVHKQTKVFIGLVGYYEFRHYRCKKIMLLFYVGRYDMRGDGLWA